MEDFTQYLEDEFIIWNSSFGVRDFVTIGELKKENNIMFAWLDEPYEMVGPFNFNTLLKEGIISFEACQVITKETWKEKQDFFKKESYIRQQQSQQELNEEIKQHSLKKQTLQQDTHKEYRKLLSLPLEGKLEKLQIKTAYRKLAKTVHPDVGGSQKEFVRLTEAKEALLLFYL